MELGFDLKEWEEVEPVEMGEREVLELGGHEVKIVDARLYTSELSGNTSVKVCVDISGKDKQAGFFERQYESLKASDPKAKWPAGGTRYLSLKRESLQFTKGVVKALENSNKGFKFDIKKGWEQINGLKCAGVFGLEEYIDNEEKTRTGTKLVNFRSLDKLPEINIPRVKLLDGSYIDYESYKPSANNSTTTKSVEISDADLPF